MTILALETAGPVLSVALVAGDRNWYRERRTGWKHVESLLPETDALLSSAGIRPGDLDLIVCSRGPGSFTGLRIGMSTAKGIAAGTGRPLVSLPTFDPWGRDLAFWPGIVAAVMDARKDRVYAALYRGGERISEDLDIEPGALKTRLAGSDPVLVTGPDAPLMTALSGDYVLDPLFGRGRALTLAGLGREKFDRDGADPPDAGPVYIRRSEAEIALDGGGDG